MSHEITPQEATKIGELKVQIGELKIERAGLMVKVHKTEAAMQLLKNKVLTLGGGGPQEGRHP